MIAHDNILIVPVPDDAHSFDTIKNPVVYGLCISMLRGYPDYACIHYNLPPGSWRIVGRAKELNEEQWGIFVKHDLGPMTNKIAGYDYANEVFGGCTTATESGMSLLRSLGIDPETNPLILIKEK